MKKTILSRTFASRVCIGLFVAVGLLTSGALVAAESDLDIKLGAGLAKTPNKAGFDGAISYDFGIDKMFTIGPEIGLNWISWQQEVPNSSVTVGTITTTKSADINSFTIPAILNFKLRFANVKESTGVWTPYITVGAGYSYAAYGYSVPAYTDTVKGAQAAQSLNVSFTGFTYQALLGSAFTLGQGSNMQILAEVGYRGAQLKDKDSNTFDMSGVIAHVGVRFAFGAAASGDF